MVDNGHLETCTDHLLTGFLRFPATNITIIPGHTPVNSGQDEEGTAGGYSTVTLLARLRGLSTSYPLAMPT